MLGWGPSGAIDPSGRRRRSPQPLPAGHNGTVRRQERERILGEQRAAGETLREARERKLLEAELEFNTLKGRPLRQRLRNAKPTADSYIVSLGGPLPYMQRLRTIEDETADHERRLADSWADTAAGSGDDGAVFARRWAETARRWTFSAVNELIAKHNRYYPVEARLPMDPRTGGYALVAGRPYELRPLDAAWVLERFPAELDVARAAARRAA